MSDFFKKENNYQVSEVTRLKNQYESGKLNRRSFLQGMMAVGLTATTATAILTGSRDVRAETPKRGGRLKVGYNIHGPSDTLDPVLNTDGLAYSRNRAHLNRLVQFNPDLTVRPELAESFEVNSDATEFTFKLRKDVTFHDGKDLTADDVVYSMNRHLGENSVSKAKTLVGMISEWKKLDSHTVKAVLSSPNADLIPTLATFHFSILQDGCEEKSGYFNKTIGTGPYMVEEFSPGVRSISKKNPNYWREGGWVDEIEMFGIVDNSARVNAVVSGAVDMAATIDPKSYKQVNQADGVSLFANESGAYAGMVLMLDRSPGNNPDFVKTIKLLQNRKRIIRSVLKGQGGVGNDHPIGPAYGATHCETLEQTEIDLDQAKFHLTKSGINKAQLQGSEGIRGALDPALLMQAEANKIGLQIDIKKVPHDGYWGTTWMNTPFHSTNWNMRPTAYVMMELAYAPDAPWNESIWKNERMGMLLSASRSETDTAKRKDMFCEMQGLIRAEAGTVIWGHTNYVDAAGHHVKGLPRVPLAELGGAEWPEFVWLDS